jgi:hypothetical protein
LEPASKVNSEDSKAWMSDKLCKIFETQSSTYYTPEAAVRVANDHLQYPTDTVGPPWNNFHELAAHTILERHVPQATEVPTAEVLKICNNMDILGDVQDFCVMAALNARCSVRSMPFNQRSMRVGRSGDASSATAQGDAGHASSSTEPAAHGEPGDVPDLAELLKKAGDDNIESQIDTRRKLAATMGHLHGRPARRLCDHPKLDTTLPQLYNSRFVRGQCPENTPPAGTKLALHDDPRFPPVSAPPNSPVASAIESHVRGQADALRIHPQQTERHKWFLVDRIGEPATMKTEGPSIRKEPPTTNNLGCSSQVKQYPMQNGTDAGSLPARLPTGKSVPRVHKGDASTIRMDMQQCDIDNLKSVVGAQIQQLMPDGLKNLPKPTAPPASPDVARIPHERGAQDANLQAVAEFHENLKRQAQHASLRAEHSEKMERQTKLQSQNFELLSYKAVYENEKTKREFAELQLVDHTLRGEMDKVEAKHNTLLAMFNAEKTQRLEAEGRCEAWEAAAIRGGVEGFDGFLDG